MHFGCCDGFLGNGTLSYFIVSPVVLDKHLHLAEYSVMLFMMDFRIEVIVGIVFKHTPSKSSISNGLMPSV